MNYDIDWEKTIEHIRFLLEGKTHAKNFSEAFGVSERAAEYKLRSPRKSELSLKELLILSDYFECDVKDLIVLVGEEYEGPAMDGIDSVPKNEMQDKSSQEVINRLEFCRQWRETNEIRDLYEFLLYLPLIEDVNLRDVVYRCYGNLEWSERYYAMSQLNYLYKSIPDSPAKDDADKMRDNMLRVKGHPGNNLYGAGDKEFNKHYFENLVRYVREGNVGLYSEDNWNKWIEKRRMKDFGKQKWCATQNVEAKG